jgi:hypothetical protein
VEEAETVGKRSRREDISGVQCGVGASEEIGEEVRSGGGRGEEEGFFREMEMTFTEINCYGMCLKKISAKNWLRNIGL